MQLLLTSLLVKEHVAQIVRERSTLEPRTAIGLLKRRTQFRVFGKNLCSNRRISSSSSSSSSLNSILSYHSKAKGYIQMHKYGVPVKQKSMLGRTLVPVGAYPPSRYRSRLLIFFSLQFCTLTIYRTAISAASTAASSQDSVSRFLVPASNRTPSTFGRSCLLDGLRRNSTAAQ